jgi:hypothetical protein
LDLFIDPYPLKREEVETGEERRGGRDSLNYLVAPKDGE